MHTVGIYVAAILGLSAQANAAPLRLVSHDLQRPDRLLEREPPLPPDAEVRITKSMIAAMYATVRERVPDRQARALTSTFSQAVARSGGDNEALLDVAVAVSVILDEGTIRWSTFEMIRRRIPRAGSSLAEGAGLHWRETERLLRSETWVSSDALDKMAAILRLSHDSPEAFRLYWEAVRDSD